MRTPECAQTRTTLFTSPRQSRQQPVPYQAVNFAAKDQIPFSGLPRRADYRRRDIENERYDLILRRLEQCKSFRARPWQSHRTDSRLRADLIVFREALRVIAQNFQNTAIRGVAAAAFMDHALKFGTQRLQPRHALFDLSELAPGNLMASSQGFCGSSDRLRSSRIASSVNPS